MIEKDIQDMLINILQKKDLPYIHIPNKAFSKYSRGAACLKDFPDIQFAYEGYIYMIEIGVKDGNTPRNKARKGRQKVVGEKWAYHGAVRFEMIFSYNELNNFINSIGLI